MQTQSKRWLLLAAILFAQLPIVMDMTILHVAVPTLALDLEATGTEILWIIDIYPLLLAGLLVPMGTLADSIGQRKIFLSGVALFLIASVAAAYAPSALALIAARGLMGVAAAMAFPSVLAIIRQTFENSKERAVALGLWSMVSSAGAAIGPLTGGILLEHFWWGSVFLINVVIIAIVWPFIYVLVPRTWKLHKAEWQVGQALVLIAGLMSAVYGLKSIFKLDGNFGLSASILLAGIFLVGLFARQQMRSSRPMLDVELFSYPAIRAGLVTALVVAGALVGVELTIALELQFAVGLSPLQAGLFILPLMASAAVGGPLAGVVVAKTGLRKLASCALLLAALSVGGLAFSDFHHAGVHIFALLATLGLSLGVGLTASSIAVMGSAPPEKAGAAGAVEGTGYDLGAGLGITIVGVALSTVYSNAIEIPEAVPAALAEMAKGSISDTMIAANNLEGVVREALIEAGKAAFVSAHSTVLLSSALLMLMMSMFVYILLRGFKDGSLNEH